MVKSVRYLKNDKLFGESIHPSNIISAKGVLLFNTKQRKIAYYESKTGFTVKGTTLQNVTGGVVKSCGRKNVEWIDLLRGCVSSRIVREINTLPSKEQSLTGRINKDTLILRVIS